MHSPSRWFQDFKFSPARVPKPEAPNHPLRVLLSSIYSYLTLIVRPTPFVLNSSSERNELIPYPHPPPSTRLAPILISEVVLEISPSTSPHCTRAGLRNVFEEPTQISLKGFGHYK